MSKLLKSTGLWLALALLASAATVGIAHAQAAAPAVAQAAHSSPGSALAALEDVQMYNRSVHIMAMLLLGFGFLMVFVKKYGLSALTATYLLVSVSLPLYFVIRGSGALGEAQSPIQTLILAEFGAASLLIAAGAVLGRLKMLQYILLGALFLPAYMLNEWLVVEGAFGLVKSFADTGGSIVIHAFGALFGLSAAFSLTTREQASVEVESDFTSDRFSLLGSMVLWVFWPSFCAALVPAEDVPATAVNVVLALSGATLVTYAATTALHKGKISAADIANATLAGGVAIGSTCDTASPTAAFVIGVAAGALSTFGFAVLQGKLQALTHKVDTCGVLNLHGLPGLLGGLAALVVVSEIDVGAQLIGIVLTVAIAVASGLVVGKLVSLVGARLSVYDDAEEFE